MTYAENDRAAIYVQCHSVFADDTHCPVARAGIKLLPVAKLLRH
jgi:hypothetical protein